MPTAVNGDRRFHASITDWLGATHVSKPWPVKSPGAGGAAAWAGEDIKKVAARPVTMPAIVSREVGEGTMRILRGYVSERAESRISAFEVSGARCCRSDRLRQ